MHKVVDKTGKVILIHLDSGQIVFPAEMSDDELKLYGLTRQDVKPPHRTNKEIKDDSQS